MKRGARHERQRDLDRGVEPLGVPRGQHHAAAPRRVQQLVGLGERGR